MTLPDDIELRQDISDIEMYTKDGEAIDFIHLEHLDKIMELFNKYNGTVDFTKPEVNLIDIASPNMSPEASKVVSDALERSAEVMNKVAKPVENGELREQIADIVIRYVPATSVMAERQKTARESAIEKLEALLAQEKAKWVAEVESAVIGANSATYHDHPFLSDYAIGQIHITVNDMMLYDKSQHFTKETREWFETRINAIVENQLEVKCENDLRNRQRQALAKLLDKENTK